MSQTVCKMMEMMVMVVAFDFEKYIFVWAHWSRPQVFHTKLLCRALQHFLNSLTETRGYSLPLLLTGLPGIGKSLFMVYLTYRYLQRVNSNPMWPHKVLSTWVICRGSVRERKWCSGGASVISVKPSMIYLVYWGCENRFTKTETPYGLHLRGSCTRTQISIRIFMWTSWCLFGLWGSWRSVTGCVIKKRNGCDEIDSTASVHASAASHSDVHLSGLMRLRKAANTTTRTIAAAATTAAQAATAAATAANACARVSGYGYGYDGVEVDERGNALDAIDLSECMGLLTAEGIAFPTQFFSNIDQVAHLLLHMIGNDEFRFVKWKFASRVISNLVFKTHVQELLRFALQDRAHMWSYLRCTGLWEVIPQLRRFAELQQQKKTAAAGTTTFRVGLRFHCELSVVQRMRCVWVGGCGKSVWQCQTKWRTTRTLFLSMRTASQWTLGLFQITTAKYGPIIIDTELIPLLRMCNHCDDGDGDAAGDDITVDDDNTSNVDDDNALVMLVMLMMITLVMLMMLIMITLLMLVMLMVMLLVLLMMMLVILLVMITMMMVMLLVMWWTCTIVFLIRVHFVTFLVREIWEWLRVRIG